MKKPRISIIVPVYNVEKYLQRCIKSILMQTFADFELLLIDDGSTDGSGAICDEYARKEQRVIALHQQNGGVSAARNLGLDYAQGEWVCFCDSDDFVQPEYLESMINNIVTNKSLVLAPYKREDGLTFNLSEGTVFQEEMVKSFFEQRWIALSAPYAKLYNRQLLELHTIRFPLDIHMGEDAIFILKYINVIDAITAINACNYFVRKVSGSLSSRYYSFSSEWKCYTIWREELLRFANRYGTIFNTPLQKVWEARGGEMFTRCLQCLYKQEKALALKEQIKYLQEIEQHDYKEYFLYYHPDEYSKRIFKAIVHYHSFPLFLFIKNIIRHVVTKLQ